MNSKQSFTTLGIAFLMAFSPEVKAEGEKSVEKGVDYLVSGQSSDGSWSADDKLKLVDSSESFQALQRATGGENARNKSLQFFASLASDNNEVLSYKLLVLSNSTAPLDEYLAKLTASQKNDGGWGLSDSKRGSIPHTLLSVNALFTTSKANNSVLNNGVEFLIRSQQVNGSWIFSGEHSLSDTAHTAQVLLILKKVQLTNTFSGSGLDQAIAKAQQYLEGKASADGSYGDLLDTAWSYLAFVKIKQPAELQTTLTLITNSQKPNGSWNDKIYDTAICLQALTAIQIPQSDLPDLELTEENISFNPTAPLTGNEVTVTATIFNTGKLDAENVKVEFFNRDPRLGGTALGTVQTIPLLPAGGSAVATTSFITTGMVGPEQIVVFVDRDNAINEVTKTNNAAAKILTVGGMPDLAIAASDITLSNPNPKAFETVDLIVTIHNIGNESVQNIPVKIYDNDQLLSEFILSGVNGDSTNKGIITTGFTAETHNIRVELDPAHTITREVNLANNTATKSFTVDAEPEKPVDLAVESITTTPGIPLSTEKTIITVNIANLGGVDITTAFQASLSVDGTAIGVIAVPQLLKGQRAVLNFENITLAAGERTVSAVADSGNVITADTQRANNTLTKTITVRDSSTPAAIEVVSFTATPATATVGGTVLFKMTVKNTGTQVANNVNIALLNGTSTIGSAQIPSLAGGQNGELQFEYAFSSNGDFTIRAVAALDGKTAEKSAAVKVTGASDLEITAAGILLSTPSVTAFQEFEITANIKNIGNMDAVNVPVRFLANGEVLSTMNLSGVSAGGSNKATLKTSLPKGSYNITVSLDPDRTLANEHNRTNNTAYKPLAVTAPLTTQADLAVSGLLIDPALPIQNTPANLTATIVNLGGTDIAAPFSVEFKDGETVLHTFSVSSLSAGQKAVLKLAANLTAGAHMLLVTADSGNVVTEETKANNSLSKQLTVASDATPADVTVASVTLDKASPNVRDKIIATAAIYNAGTTSAENFFVRVMVNGTALGEDYKITSLPGGGTFNLQIPYTVTKEGENTIQIIADAQNNVEESDEANNTGSVNFSASTIARPDLTIPEGGLATIPENPQPSVTFEYKITVANLGNENAAASKLIVSEGNPQMAGAVHLAEAAIPAIEAGKQAVVSVNLKLDANKDNIFIFIDSDEEIAEANEDNNLFKTSIGVSSLPDLYVNGSAISFSHTNLDNGSMVGINFKVDNIGNADASAFKVQVFEKVENQNQLIGEKTIGSLAAKGSADVSINWLGTPGNKEIVVTVDSDNAIKEASKENNTATKTQEFVRSGVGLKLYLSASGQFEEKGEFRPYENIKIVPQIYFSEAQSFVTVIDPNGKTHSPHEEAGAFFYGTGQNPPGVYRVVLDVYNSEGYYIDSAEKEFTLLPEFRISDIVIRTTPSLMRVNELEPVNLTFIIQNRSNIDGTASLQIKIKNPSGEYVYDETMANVAFESGKQKIVALDPLATTFVAEGRYVIEAMVTPAGQTPIVKNRNYDVLPANSLKITKTLTPTVLDPLSEGKVHVKINVEGVGTQSDIAPLDLILVMDISGSMWGEPLEKAKEAAVKFVDMLPDNARAGLVIFDDWGRLHSPLSFDRDALKSKIQGLWDGGGTAIGDGMKAARTHFQEVSTGRKRIEIVLSDGDTWDQGVVYDEIEVAKSESIEVHTIGLGYYMNEPLMIDIAEETGGEYYFSPEPADLERVFQEVFESAVSAAANNVKITDTINTNKIQIIEGTVTSEPASVNPVTGEIVWTKDKMTIDDKFSYEFDVMLTDLVPGETRVVNQNLNVEFLTPDGTKELKIEVGEQSVSVGELGAISIVTDKEQYLASENVNMKVDLTLKGNKIRKYSTKEAWEGGTLNNIDATAKIGSIRLAAASVSDPQNLIQNGDFESGNFNGWTVQNYAGISDWHRYEGNYSAYIYTGMSGSSSIHQTIAIPGNASSANLSFVTYVNDYYGFSCRVEIRDTDNNLLKELIRIKGSHNWTVHEFDLLEFKGKTVRLIFKPSGEGEFYLDNVRLNVVKTTFRNIGTANYVIDATNVAVWDKLTSDQITTAGNSIKFRVRGLDNVSALSQATWSEYLAGTDVQLPEIVSRYLELEVLLNADENATSPELSNLKLSYISYSSEDNLRVIVDVKDQANTVVRTYNDLRPNLQLGRMQTFHLVFNTGTNQPGPYTANAALYVQTVKAASDKDDFEIVTAGLKEVLDGNITTDKREYTGGETVQMVSRVNNLSQNASVNSLNVNVKIQNSSNEAISNVDYVITNLLPQSLNSKSLAFAVGMDLPLGEYTGIQTVKAGEEQLFVRQTKFTVVSSIEHGKGLSGTLTAQPLVVKRRIGDLNFAVTAQNTGNVDLAGVVFKVKLFHPGDLTELKSMDGAAVDLAKSGTHTGTHPYGSKVELMPGTYPATLTAEFTYNGVPQSIPLDTAGVVVTNSAPVADAGSDISTTTTVRVGIPIMLNGSGSTDENSTDAAHKNDIVSYEWKKGDTVLGSGETLTVNLVAGVHDITLTVTDTCGAKHSDGVKVTITQIVLPPTLTDLSPAHERIVKELVLGAKASDPIWGIEWSSLVFKSGTTVLTASYDAATGAITSALPADAADGWYDLNIFIKNQGGADATTPAWRVGLDRTAPVITDLSPSADVYLNHAQPTLSAKLTDAFSGVNPASIRVKIGETVLEHTYNAETGTVSASVPTELADGWHDATVEVADLVGNANSATWRVGVDVTPPTITNMLPSANTELNESALEISAVVTDALSGIKSDSIVLKLNDTVVAHTYDAEAGKVSFNATGLANGAQTVFISVNDNAGNTSSTSWVFNIMLRVPGSEYLLFHNSSTGELTITGGNKTVNGIAHSNAAIKIRGNHTTITGQTTAVGTISVNGSGHNVALQQSNAPAVAMPVYPYDYYVANATQVHNGDLTVANGQTLQPGIHLVNGNVTIRATELTGVTIVATGNIKLSSKDTTITHGDSKYKVALYSKNGSIDSSVNGLTVTGVVYAPAGQIKVQSNGSSFTGAIVADRVEFNGQNLTLNPLEY